MSLSSSRLLLLAGLLIVLVNFYGFWTFDRYTKKTSDEIANLIVRSELARIQQGNLLEPITKLQAAVFRSSVLAGVAAYETKGDAKNVVPVILIGETYGRPLSQSEGSERIGIFARVTTKKVTDSMYVSFYFKSDFGLRLFIISSLITTGCLIAFWLLTRQIEVLKLTARRQAMSQVTEQVTHDLRSPLSALKLFASTITRSDDSYTLVSKVVSRIESVLANLENSLKNIDLSHDALSIQNLLSEIIAEKRVEFSGFEFNLKFESDSLVVGNKGELARVFSNVINNAVEASRVGSEVVVSQRTQGGFIIVDIRDSGEGIAPAHINSVFNRGQSFGKKNGRGLGLFHAKETIEKLGGRIFIESELAKGTVVSVQLPIVAG